VSKLRLEIPMALDGFVAGPSQGVTLARTVATPTVVYLHLVRH
jgi:hypothetical protein